MFEYWKSTLSLRERNIYEDICNAVRSYTFSVKVRGSGNEISHAFSGVLSDHPEFYYLGNRLEAQGNIYGINVSLQELFNRSQRAQLDIAMHSTAKGICGNYSGNAEQFERLVCAYIANNVYYEIDAQYNQSAAAALCYKKAQCSGIAKAVKYLFDQVGINCIVVNGEADGNGAVGPHSWNMIQLNGNWYHLDPTFILGSNNHSGREIVYPYFNYSDTLIKKTHHWKDKTPAANDNRYDSYVSTQTRTQSSTAKGTNYRSDICRRQECNDKSGIPVVKNKAGLFELLGKNVGFFSQKLVYVADKPATELQTVIMEQFADYLRAKNFECKYSCSFDNGVWTLTTSKIK